MRERTFCVERRTEESMKEKKKGGFKMSLHTSEFCCQEINTTPIEQKNEREHVRFKGELKKM